MTSVRRPQESKEKEAKVLDNMILNLKWADDGKLLAMWEYVQKRANPVEAERIGLDYTRGGKYPCI
jgi:hypothetical protein